MVGIKMCSMIRMCPPNAARNIADVESLVQLVIATPCKYTVQRSSRLSTLSYTCRTVTPSLHHRIVRKRIMRRSAGVIWPRRYLARSAPCPSSARRLHCSNRHDRTNTLFYSPVLTRDMARANRSSMGHAY